MLTEFQLTRSGWKPAYLVWHRQGAKIYVLLTYCICFS